MKTLAKILLALYLAALLWLVLFKLSFDLSSVLAHHQSRSVNFIPFVNLSEGTIRETISNFIVFIPFGILLALNFRHSSFIERLSCIFMFSLAAETLQYILAIGTTDATDIITNTTGGLLGLAFYQIGAKHINKQKFDQFILIAGIILLLALLFLRVFVLRVKY